MCGDWWISILGLCQFLCVCGLSILAVILIKGNEKRNRKETDKGRGSKSTNHRTYTDLSLTVVFSKRSGLGLLH